MKILNLLNQFNECNTISESDTLMRQIMKHLACDKFSYNFYGNKLNLSQTALHVLCTETVIPWQNHYVSAHYEEIDPILKKMRYSHQTLSWRVEDELQNYSKKEQVLFSDALDHGLTGGFAVPIHGPNGDFANLVIQDANVLSVIERKPQTKFALQITAFQYHSTINELVHTTKNQNPLTKREKICLRFTAQHQTAKTIAKELKISPRTVGFHLENAMLKLNANSKYEAVTNALRLGWL